MTNQEYAANLLVEAANILGSEEKPVVSYQELNEDADYISDLGYRINVMCEYAVNVIPYESDTLTEGFGSIAKGAWNKLKEIAKKIWEKIKELFNKVKTFFNKIARRRQAQREGKVPSAEKLNIIAKKIYDTLGVYRKAMASNGEYDEEEIKNLRGEIAAELSRTEDYITIAKGREIPNYEEHLNKLKAYGEELNKMIAGMDAKKKEVEDLARAAVVRQQRAYDEANRRIEAEREAERQRDLRRREREAYNRTHRDVILKSGNMVAMNVHTTYQMLEDMVKTDREIARAITKISEAARVCLPRGTNPDEINVAHHPTAPIKEAPQQEAGKHAKGKQSQGNNKGKKAAERARIAALRAEAKARTEKAKQNPKTQHNSVVLDSLCNAMALCESITEAEHIMRTIRTLTD